ncbi:Calcium and integrin-binding protein 1 [Myotis davidii]|uniref:Calcium and integrin-binding protein 1 n=1 Tax=Myotis davidii TaxID=225400 RepID=L5LHS5_MYODS|nr:Calcium and integrin-binding protein 1 [Myotis davidii]
MSAEATWGLQHANPFRERICRVFSTSPARDSLSFEDFLDLLSVFSDTATPDIKSHYAFRIFDFDDDGTLNREDLSQLVNCLTGEGEDTRLSASEMKQLIDNVSSWAAGRGPNRAGPGWAGPDGTLNREDLSQLVNCLTGEGEDTRLSASEMKQLIDNILEESDIDRDGTINLSEFQHVISRSPDFAKYDSGPACGIWV